MYTKKWNGSEVSSDVWGFIEHRDAAHNGGFLALAHYLVGNKDLAKKIMTPIKSILLKPLYNPFKHPTYVWSNSEDIRRKTYDSFLSKIEKVKYNEDYTLNGHIVKEKKGNFDFQCGLNGDQTMPINIYFSLVGDKKEHLKFLLGLLLRLGFYSSFTDHILLKPHHLSCVFRTYKWTRWLCYFTDITFFLQTFLPYKPISESTTNKIRQFLYLIQAKKFGENFWIKWARKRINKEHYQTLSDYYEQSFKVYWSVGEKTEIWKTMPFTQVD